MRSKNKQLLAYIIKNHPRASVTSLMKLSYLSDLVSLQKSQTQISDFQYKRYHYGPFDNKIYGELQNLVDDDIVQAEQDYTPLGDEFVIYLFKDKEDISFDKLSNKEQEAIDEVLESVRGYGAKCYPKLPIKLSQ